MARRRGTTWWRAGPTTSSPASATRPTSTTGRSADLLTLDLQPELAKGLGYKARGGLLASELFMRDYYRRASELYQLAAASCSPTSPAAKPRPSRASGGFEVQGGELFARGAGAEGRADARPGERGRAPRPRACSLSDCSGTRCASGCGQVDVAFRTSRDAGRAFLRLFERRGRVAPALRELHETGVLGRLIPELARVTFLVQHDHFHRYTVDEHTLKAVDALDEVARGEDGVPAAFGQVFARSRTGRRSTWACSSTTSARAGGAATWSAG